MDKRTINRITKINQGFHATIQKTQHLFNDIGSAMMERFRYIHDITTAYELGFKDGLKKGKRGGK